ncbi:MAG: RIO1 family regulatory kinase/ATPase [Candidatus Pacearchaeota archaeon]
MPLKLIQQGAEAKILLDETNKQIIKDRIPKSYRIKILDDKIRKQRTKSETKLLIKASQIINTPIPQESKQNNFQITMPFIDGKKLSEHLDEFSLEKQKSILKQIGRDIAKLHDENIIHGDLTTSNMILVEKYNDKFNKKKIKSNKQINNLSKEKEVISINRERSEPIIYFIDFGLGFFNGKFEDKAVDIHLLKQALEAKHFKHWQEIYQSFLEGYKNSKNYEKTINQLIKVEKRGRYRH